MQGWLKGESHILKTAIMVPRKRLSRAIAATFWPRGRRALRARRPRGPNVKKFKIQDSIERIQITKNRQRLYMSYTHLVGGSI